jgi:hypothetical protein
MRNKNKDNVRLVNLTFSDDSVVVDSFVEDVNLSLKKEFKLAKKPIDIQFRKRIKDYIEQIDSLDEDELLDNLETIKSIYIDKIIRPTLIELITNSEDKNLFTSLKLDMYDITSEEVMGMQALVNSLGSNEVQDRLVTQFGNLVFTYVAFKLAKKRHALLKDVRF